MATPHPLYLDGPEGPIFLNAYLPEIESASGQLLLHLPAFGEEMNKSRHMVSRQAALLAANGNVVLVPDLYGCGDSAGEFSATDWQSWRTQVIFLLDQFERLGCPGIVLWGHRLGCLLAADAMRERRSLVAGLLFWQPVYNGKQFFAQFLRLRMAAAMMQGREEPVAELRTRLLDGESVDVAGYRLSPSLYEQTQSLEMTELLGACECPVQLLEVVSGARGELSPLASRFVETLQQQGIDCSASHLCGEPFWTTQELAFCDELLAMTTAIVASMPSASALDVAAVENRLQQLADACDHPSQVPISFKCGQETLFGVLHGAASSSRRGVIIVVGGPQYRVGSHRQFVYLAQALASQGIPCLRFDYRGMGDSTGELRGFDYVAEDIRSAVDCFFQHCDSLEEVVLWGLCDAATASALYAADDSRVAGLILANPWVYSPQGAARAYMRHYYLQRLFSKALWKKIFTGGYNPLSSARSFLGLLSQASEQAGDSEEPVQEAEQADPEQTDRMQGRGNLAPRLTAGLEAFAGPVLLIMSSEDLTAAEFDDAASDNRRLRGLLSSPRLKRLDMAGADHTFSEIAAREAVDQHCVDWLKSW